MYPAHLAEALSALLLGSRIPGGGLLRSRRLRLPLVRAGCCSGSGGWRRQVGGWGIPGSLRGWWVRGRRRSWPRLLIVTEYTVPCRWPPAHVSPCQLGAETHFYLDAVAMPRHSLSLDALSPAAGRLHTVRMFVSLVLRTQFTLPQRQGI